MERRDFTERRRGFLLIVDMFPFHPSRSHGALATPHSQKMLVMSESRLKIQKTSGAEMKTKDQDTPLMD